MNVIHKHDCRCHAAVQHSFEKAPWWSFDFLTKVCCVQVRLFWMHQVIHLVFCKITHLCLFVLIAVTCGQMVMAIISPNRVILSLWYDGLTFTECKCKLAKYVSAKLQISSNSFFFFTYAATWHLLWSIFDSYLVTLLCRFLHKTHLVGVSKTSWFGLKYLFWLPQH